MDLIWVLAVIAGCLGLAACTALALLRPMDADRMRLRPIANAHRLTRLPEYVRARRARTTTAVGTIVLLVVMFACAIVIAARPTGLPTSATQSERGEPEDVMVCIGASDADPAVSATLGFFTDYVDGLRTERIGVTSRNRRVVPLTRDYQYAKVTFATYARAAAEPGDLGAFSPSVTYVDYAESVEDLLALCLTGFPAFEDKAPQRRSIIYVGPGSLGEPGESRPSLFTAEDLRTMTLAAGVQLNALVTGPASSALTALAGDTGGRALPADTDVAARAADIRAHPPAARFGDPGDAGGRPLESPDLPLALALLTALALAAWPVVRRR